MIDEVATMERAQGKAMRFAVIGAGISGLSAAWLLGQAHDVVLFEAAPRLGGHANTVRVAGAGGETAVDTGFIVYNEATYPNFIALMDHLRIATQPTEMSFAVSLDGGRLEYSGTSIAGLFAQRSNLVRPRFWAMLQDITRFYRHASRDVLAGGAAGISLGDYLARAVTAPLSGTITFCRWQLRSGRPPVRKSCPILLPPSCVSITITDCSNSATGRSGAP